VSLSMGFLVLVATLIHIILLTQPGHPSGVGKMSTSVKTGKITAGYAVNLQHSVNLAPLYGCLHYRAELRVFFVCILL